MVVPLVLSLSACLAVCPPGEEPGTVVMVGGEVRPIAFSLPGGIDYQLSHDAFRLALWFDPDRTQPAPPLTTFQTPAQIAHGDLTGDARIDGADVQTFVDVLLGNNTDPALIAQADFDGSGLADALDLPRFVAALLGRPRDGDINLDGNINGGDVQPFVQALLEPATAPDVDLADLDFNGTVDLADLPLLVDALLFGVAPQPDTTITLFVEGLTTGTDLCDAPVDLLTDPQDNGTFALADTAEITVADLSISPQTGGLGTPITIILTPAIAPLSFDANTTATWTGIFQPMVGDPTAPFTINYSASQFHELSAAQAVLLIGDGTVTNMPDLAVLEGPGIISGTLTLNLSGLSLQSDLNFAPLTDAATWHEMDYPDGPGGAALPVVGAKANGVIIFFLSTSSLPDPLNPSEALLLGTAWAQKAIVVLIDENSTTTANAPATVQVDLITYDANGVEADRVTGLVLNKVTGDDGDPDHIVYHNDLNVPVIVVDVDLDQAAFPNVIPLRAVGGGSSVIVPMAN